ncbi:hypothetical protein [uncultured Chryseobacterium sp.]|uniref:hypothetical protein n=1 Tax=uncultured Chryseobacterium sp. TaxID=259322 RepID=UPI0025E5F440|nr:hypothetical protein [uncultured Chryseobacterium sp.]
MIRLKEFPDKVFTNNEEAFKFLIANKALIITQKKSVMKYADALPYFGTLENENKEIVKAVENVELQNATTIKVVAVSNACNWYDSHGDVSIKGSWNRTAKNTTDGLHLQEHQMKYDKLISDNVSFSVETKTWKELGYNYEGKTECLVMTSQVEKEDNPYMFEKYIKGKVKNHSSGLRYVDVEFAINSEADWAKDEKAVWDKYYPDIINKEDVDERGYFFAVKEQKIIENSAVLKGSNPATPTISVEPASGTSAKQDPVVTTPKSEQKPNINLNLFI